MHSFSAFLHGRPFWFIAASLFAYGGAVNLGFSDIFYALPMIGFLLYAIVKWPWRYKAAGIAVFAICAALYTLKSQQNTLFYPMLGRVFLLQEDACLTSDTYAGETFLLIDAAREDKRCPPPYASADVVAGRILKKGLRFRVEGVEVSHADFGEQYLIIVTLPEGKLRIFPSDHSLFTWQNGRTMEFSDMWRGIFYYPSLLMYWPMLPVIIPAWGMSYAEALLGNQ